jgi:hypothetical protein
MKMLLVISTVFSLFLMPFVVYSQPEQTKPEPPVEQNLVPEGEFALKLVPALKMGTTENETEAIDMLSSVGITPLNGWIANYPITPDIIGELETTILAAADAKKLSIEKEEALKAFQDLTAEFGLDVASESSDEYAQTQSGGYAEPPDSTVINNYYYDAGPPVVTYYPPPWDYYYLYAWVPYPFWWHGFHFGGFFVLHDFHRVVIVNKKPCVITNHFKHPVTRKVAVIDPAKRRSGDFFRDEKDRLHRRGFRSPEVRKGAASIFERSREQRRFSSPGVPRPRRELTERNSPNFEGRSGREDFDKRGQNLSTSRGREGSGRQVGPEQRSDRERFRTDFRDRGDRSLGKPGRIERRKETDSSRPSVDRGRTFTTSNPNRERFSAPSAAGRSSGPGRSFTAPSMGQRGFGRASGAPERSFSAPSMGSRGSSGGIRTGGTGRSFGKGSLAGGGGRGGCRGRC